MSKPRTLRVRSTCFKSGSMTSGSRPSDCGALTPGAKAEELGVDYVLAKDLQASNLESILERMDQFLYQCDDTYITVCSDVFSSAFAPGVSAPQSLGLDPEIVLPLIKHVLRTRKVRGFDICEISPRFDQDNTTANLGAVIIFAVVNTLCRLNGLSI